MLKITFILFFSFELFKAYNTTDCPESDILFPCLCIQNNGSLPDISCSRKDVNVSEIIHNIRVNGKGVDQTFGKLFWTNGKQINITDNFFTGVSFQHLYIGTRRQYANVTHISAGAFAGISHQIKSISIRSRHLTDEYSLFDALRRLTIIESIAIEGIGVQIVPKNAFQTPEECLPLSDCVQKNLKSITFRVGVNTSLISLLEIESFAFNDLPNLVTLDLSSHEINRIHKNAFNFSLKSDQILEIDLSNQWDKDFNSESIEEKAFEETNRPIHLDLYGNRYLTTLSETVFRPFLESDPRNRLRLGMKMDCNCDLYWLWMGRHQFRKQFLEWTYDNERQMDQKFTIQCSEGEENFWDIKDSDFSECQPNESKNEL